MAIDPTAQYNRSQAGSVRNSESGVKPTRSIRSIVGAPVGMDDQRAEVHPRSPSLAQEERHPVIVAPIHENEVPVEEEEEYRSPSRVDRHVSLARNESRKSMAGRSTRTTRTTASRRSVLPDNPSELIRMLLFAFS